MPVAIQPISLPRGPAWEIATLFPDQGSIAESDYLWLTRHINRLVEFTDGRVEVLPMPTTQHQLIVLHVFRRILGFAETHDLGMTLFAPLRVKIRDGKFREPDIVFMSKANLARAQDEYWLGADLVVEIVSPNYPARDVIEKRAEYAEAGISEYWIVDPQSHHFTILQLENGVYQIHSEAAESGEVTSNLLTGLSINVKKVFDAGKSNPTGN